MCVHQEQAKREILEFVEDVMEGLRETHGGGYQGDTAVMLFNLALIAWVYAGLPVSGATLMLELMIQRAERAHQNRKQLGVMKLMAPMPDKVM